MSQYVGKVHTTALEKKIQKEQGAEKNLDKPRLLARMAPHRRGL